jgi:hypothetical protein
MKSVNGYAIVQTVSRWFLTAEAWVCDRVSPRGIHNRQRGTGTGLSPSPSDAYQHTEF